MKSIRKITIFVCAIALSVLTMEQNGYASIVKNNNVIKEADVSCGISYNPFEVYSLTLEDENWKKIKRFDQMLEKCQINQDQLVNMSTEELFDAVFEYPLLVNVFLYDSIEEGIENVKKQFNGMAELLERRDFEKTLLKRYKKLEIPKKTRNNYDDTFDHMDKKMGSSESFKYNVTLDFIDINSVSILESMLVHYCDLSQYTNYEKDQIVNEVIEKMVQKDKSKIFENNYSEFVDEVMIENKNSEWRTVVKDSSSVQFKKMDNIYAATKKVDDKVTVVYVKTPNQSKVKCESHSANKKNSDNFALQQKKTYPNATLVGNGYSHNNCHAYAWTGRQDIYMDYKNAAIYKSDNSYVAIKSGRPTGVGQKAVWGNFKHSGIVMDYAKQDPIITSKWGGGCIWRCAASYCPYDGGITYYKRNK